MVKQLFSKNCITVLTFDVCAPKKVQNMEKWRMKRRLEDWKRWKGDAKRRSRNVPVIKVPNKI